MGMELNKQGTRNREQGTIKGGSEIMLTLVP
jgi:hypothetical protein